MLLAWFVKTLNNRRRIFVEVEEEEEEEEEEKEKEEEVDEVIGDLILPNSRVTTVCTEYKHDLEDHQPSETPLLNPPITTTSHDIHI